MNTLQLNRILSNDKFTNKYFLGAYAKDLLPKKIKFPASLIVNTHKSNKPGEHWLAMFYDKKGKCHFFDSYGFDPSFYNLDSFIKKTSLSCEYNKYNFQGLNSNLCGLYCIIFLYFKSRNISLKNLVNYFSKIKNNDLYIYNLIKKYS